MRSATWRSSAARSRRSTRPSRPTPETIDARQDRRLIDIHTHAGRSEDGPKLALQDELAGSMPYWAAPTTSTRSPPSRGALQIGRALVNIARTVLAAGELHDINAANVALAQGAIARNRDVVVGIKARLSENVASANDPEARCGARRRRFLALVGHDPHRQHILAHARHPAPAQARIVTHMYAPAPNGILDDQGRLFDHAKAVAAASFSTSATGSRIISTGPRWSARSSRVSGPIRSRPIGTSCRRPPASSTSRTSYRSSSCSMPLSQVVACATVNAARVFPSFDNRGTLNVGRRRMWRSWSCANTRVRRQLQRHPHRPPATVSPPGP